MSKRYWGIIAALAGLALAGASEPPQPSQQREQPAATQNTQQPAEIIASAIRETVIPRDKDEGCDEGDDRRESDLCAQWKAADAARDAANYAFIGLLVGIIGTALLFVTFSETRKIARREQRAYVRLKVAAGPADETLTKGQFRIVAENYGTTPATNASATGGCFMGPVPLTGYIEPDEWTDGGSGIVLHPDIENDFGVKVRLTEEEAAEARTKAGTRQLYVMAKYRYSDVFGGKHVEQICMARRSDKNGCRMETAAFGNTST